MIQNWKRCAAAGLAAVLLCQTLPAFASSAEDYEAQMDGIDQEISEIEQQQEENAAEADRLNADLDRLRGEKEEAEEYQRLLEEKIENYETRIDLARERIAELNGNILELEKEIRQADLDYADTLEKLKAARAVHIRRRADHPADPSRFHEPLRLRAAFGGGEERFPPRQRADGRDQGIYADHAGQA